MSNYAAITGSSKIVHRNQGGGSKLQGIPSSTNLNTWAHVAFRNRNVVCPCKRDIIFCMNQLGGVGAGGIPGRSYAFAPTADGTHKPFYCGHRFNYYLGNNKHLIIPKKHLGEYTLLYNNQSFYIANLGDNNSLIYFYDNHIVKVGKIYFMTISVINVNITFKVIKFNPSISSSNTGYNINILSEYNFSNGSTIYVGNKSINFYNKTTGTDANYGNSEIKIYIKNY